MAMNPTVQDLVDRLLSDGVQMWHGPERTFHGDPLSQEAAACITSLSQLNERMARALAKIITQCVMEGTELQLRMRLEYIGGEARTAIAGLDAPPADSKPERRSGTSKLVYDKERRTIVRSDDGSPAFEPRPPADSIDAVMEAALQKIAERRHPSGDPLQFADISELRDYAVDALRIVAERRAAVERIPKQEGG